MKILFEQNGESYTKVGDYYIPNITVPEWKFIGKYGIFCRTYLCIVIFTNLKLLFKVHAKNSVL